MKIVITLLAIVGLVAAGAIPKKESKYPVENFLAKQKFLFEIVYRVEDPLMFEEYIKLGKTFTYNKADYDVPENHAYFDSYYKAYQYGVTLPKGEFFGAMVASHYEQLSGLFSFFYYAKNWEVFQRNVCWARLHANEGMFIHALTLALIHRTDFHGLILPAIYEIFPQYFFNSKFVYAAEKFDYDVWSKYIMYEKEYKDLMYTDYVKYFKEYDNYNYFYTKDWKMWQWWKLMGLGEHWYSVNRFMLRDKVGHYHKTAKPLDLSKDVKLFWMPVDYTRDIHFYNQESELSYLTEDLGWNAFWYYFNIDYAAFLDGKSFGLDIDRRGEFWLYNVRQILGRYYQERLSNGYGAIPEFSFFAPVEHGYNPQLVNYNGVGFSSRKNYHEFETHGNFEYIQPVVDFFKRVEDIITKGYYTSADGKRINMRRPAAIEDIGNMMQGNVDAFDKSFATFWYMLAHMYMADVDNDALNQIYPDIFLNYETMMRDPMFYMAYKKISDVFYHFHSYIEPYTRNELLLPGVTIKHAKVSKLVTYFNLVDFDVTNLLNDKMTFVDGQFVLDKTLLARQMRLNHKPYFFNFTIESDKAQTVVVRAFLGPKYDEFGRVISLRDNRENFVEIDASVYELKPGVNEYIRESVDFVWTIEDRTTYTELYKMVVDAYEGKSEFDMNSAPPHCGYPDRLVLPRGWVKGLPMQFFYFAYPYTAAPATEETTTEPYFTCSVGAGFNQMDSLPFGYPLDRQIDEYEFFVSNMYMEDVKIYHEDTFEKYYDYKYEQFGTFDYEN